MNDFMLMKLTEPFILNLIFELSYFYVKPSLSLIYCHIFCRNVVKWFTRISIFYVLGFIEAIQSQAVAEIIQENDGSILNYLKKQAPADTPHGISQEVMDTYIRSCGGFEWHYNISQCMYLPEQCTDY